MKYTFTIIILFFFFQKTYCQNNDHNSNLKIEDLTKLEGLEYVGQITFYLDKIENIVVAVQNGKIKWNVDLAKLCGKKKRNKIYGIGFFGKEKKLSVYYRKNKVCEIDIETGEASCRKEKPPLII
ncbi:hypothetical protein [Flavobacterium sp.]|uniref:hypothetical protein n=1 Tax=Flavobacterium sp. TaxID=239 RepID=UPI002B4B8283|nr:hypothetical protein [Flavobacterium sp.]HLP63145.1 hypothetical protein [Flavobacterium sp.]